MFFISFQLLLSFHTDFDCFPDFFFLSFSAYFPVENSPKTLQKKDNRYSLLALVLFILSHRSSLSAA